MYKMIRANYPDFLPGPPESGPHNAESGRTVESGSAEHWLQLVQARGVAAVIFYGTPAFRLPTVA
jgi:hypothetical protein